MYKVELFLGKYSIGYLHKRGQITCIGGNENNAIIYDNNSFEKEKIHKDYKIRKVFYENR